MLIPQELQLSQNKLAALTLSHFINFFCVGGKNGINTGNYEEKLLFRFKFVPVWNNVVKLRKKWELSGI